MKNKIGELHYLVILIMVAALFGLMFLLWKLLIRLTAPMVAAETDGASDGKSEAVSFWVSWLVCIGCIELAWAISGLAFVFELVALVIVVWHIVQVILAIKKKHPQRQLFGFAGAAAFLLAFPYIWGVFSLMVIAVVLVVLGLSSLFKENSSSAVPENEEPVEEDASMPGIMYQGGVEYHLFGDVGYGKQYINMDTRKTIIITNFVPTGAGEADTNLGHFSWTV